MINSVKSGPNTNIPAYQAKNDASKPYAKNDNIKFGNYAYDPYYNAYYNVPEKRESSGLLGTLKNGALALTNDFLGFIGINAALIWLQKIVNGNILIGKINSHFMKNIPQSEDKKLADLALQMREKVGKPDIFYGPAQEAYYTHVGNKVVIGKDKHSALFHELGHAFQENKTNILKKLQRGRGHYAELSVLLYMLMAQRNKPESLYTDKSNQSIGDKISNFVAKSDAVVPLLAFAPELLTEAKASHEGLKFLKQNIGDKANQISKHTYKNIRNSYITCFLTYLFIPVSMMLVDAVRNSADKAIRKHRQESTFF